MKYKLISFYRIERSDKTVWTLIGHIAPGENDVLGEYATRSECIDEAFRYDVPVAAKASPEDYGWVKKLCS